MRNIAIAIGINKYRNLQDLKYAKNDAQYFCDFLRQEAGFEEIWYFSDDSPAIAGNSTEPIRSNLLTVLDDLSNSPLERIDNLWFFFAGHGSIHQNDGNDYLLMADSNQNLLEDTAISTNRILQKLRLSGAENIFLFLDACRNLGRRDGRGIGDRTTAEAKKIANSVCFFSCSPKEFSWELDQYQHGVFTYALVEGLSIQRKRATIEKLGSFLELRVPELAKGEANEVQNPIVVYDSKLKHAILMPKYADKSDLLPLKNAAFKAHRNKNLDLARRLWMQVLAVDGTDYEAIAEIEGLAVERYLGTSPQVAPNPAVESGKRNVSKAPEPNPLTIDLGNGITLDLVLVPAGSFAMGEHQVTLKEFLIGKYAVTNAQWQAVMKTKGSANCYKQFQGDLQPVVGVSWHEARAFCAKVSQLSGRAVRLSTEAEWEYAARGANQSKGYEYSGSNNLSEVGWYTDNFGSNTHPVGQKKANELGIYDMSGNVWEWCLDEWHDSYADKPEKLKSNGNEAWGDLNIDDYDNRSRLLRGGSWLNDDRNSLAASRFGGNARIQNNLIGFRLLIASS
jgi:formylglycine-generating enzyme required for sulfatase activity